MGRTHETRNKPMKTMTYKYYVILVVFFICVLELTSYRSLHFLFVHMYYSI
ncbi:hypothetical protein HanRHA438_Chr11g0525721 [Helianthus annuus]|nr:hypothetical protein HanIR_Chr11g0552081 [Helianthus annuus]KAJ0872602.1 hypothetical protein HanRHA438_Chr11g0525721 [Helianthus annuus]